MEQFLEDFKSSNNHASTQKEEKQLPAAINFAFSKYCIKPQSPLNPPEALEADRSGRSFVFRGAW